MVAEERYSAIPTTTDDCFPIGGGQRKPLRSKIFQSRQ
jgi:hypothetical protein